MSERVLVAHFDGRRVADFGWRLFYRTVPRIMPRPSWLCEVAADSILIRAR